MTGKLFTLLFGALFASLFSVPAVAQTAAQWTYGFVGNTATATYPGNVVIPQLGTLNCLGTSSGQLVSGTCGTSGSPINAKSVGAVGNGIADDTTALNLCITNAEAINGSCYIPGGQYKITGPLTIASHIRVYGDGSASIDGACNINGHCSTNMTTAINGTVILPSATVTAFTSDSNNGAIEIDHLAVQYLALPTGGSGVTAIKVSGTGVSNGVCSDTHLHDLTLIQPDIGISIADCQSFNVDHNQLFNFVTTGVKVGGGTIGTGQNDWNVAFNSIKSGPATANTCNGLLITYSAASNIVGNKFNFIPATTNCTAIEYLSQTNGTSYEPTRIEDNSLEGSANGIVFYNACATASTCSLSQGVITGNQIWTGAGTLCNGCNIFFSGNATYAWVNQLHIIGNTLNVVGGGSNNNNIIVGAGMTNNVSIEGNQFGNSSAGGSASINNGGSNANLVSFGNRVLANDAQTLGTGTTVPFTLACGTLETNTLYNSATGYLFGGTGVTAIAKQGQTYYTQASGTLPLTEITLAPGETMQVTCSTTPTINWQASNP